MSSEAPLPWQRILLQTLESWQGAGLSHVSVTETTRPAPAAAPVSSQKAPPPAHTRPAAPPEIQSEQTPEPMPSRKTSEVSQTRSENKPAAPTESNREQRIEQLKVLQARVAACQRCEELARTRTQTVFGVGNPEAKLVFIGEAPGADEDLQGEPFVGKAGQLLNKIIEAMNLRREDIYICNILRCRPPGNRTPLPTEAGHCREFLDGQLRVIRPEYIVCWGSCAATNLLGATDTIGKMRGRFYQYESAKVLCTYHPSYLLRNPAAKKDVWADMQILMREMGMEV